MKKKLKVSFVIENGESVKWIIAIIYALVNAEFNVAVRKDSAAHQEIVLWDIDFSEHYEWWIEEDDPDDYNILGFKKPDILFVDFDNVISGITYAAMRRATVLQADIIGISHIWNAHRHLDKHLRSNIKKILCVDSTDADLIEKEYGKNVPVIVGHPFLCKKVQDLLSGRSDAITKKIGQLVKSEDSKTILFVGEDFWALSDLKYTLDTLEVLYLLLKKDKTTEYLVIDGSAYSPDGSDSELRPKMDKLPNVTVVQSFENVDLIAQIVDFTISLKSSPLLSSVSAKRFPVVLGAGNWKALPEEIRLKHFPLNKPKARYLCTDLNSWLNLIKKSRPLLLARHRVGQYRRKIIWKPKLLSKIFE